MNKTIFKRVSIFMAVIMCISLLPITAFATTKPDITQVNSNISHFTTIYAIWEIKETLPLPERVNSVSVDVYDIIRIGFGDEARDRVLISFLEMFRDNDYSVAVGNDEYGDEQYKFTKGAWEHIILGKTKSQRIMNEGGLIYLVSYYRYDLATTTPTTPEPTPPSTTAPTQGGGRNTGVVVENPTTPEPLPTPVPTITPTTQEGIRVTLNGVNIHFDQPPVIQDGRTLVPLRAIFEALGASVDWNEDTQTVTAVKDGVTVTLQIGSNILTRNGENITLDVSAQLINGRTLVPARAVAESFGATVDWNAATQTVIIVNEASNTATATNNSTTTFVVSADLEQAHRALQTEIRNFEQSLNLIANGYTSNNATSIRLGAEQIGNQLWDLNDAIITASAKCGDIPELQSYKRALQAMLAVNSDISGSTISVGVNADTLVVDISRVRNERELQRIGRVLDDFQKFLENLRDWRSANTNINNEYNKLSN